MTIKSSARRRAAGRGDEALATSVPLRSFGLLRTELHRLLGLPEPAHPAETAALPLPGAPLAARPVDARTWVDSTRHDQVRFDDAGQRGPVLASVALAWLASGRLQVTAG